MAPSPQEIQDFIAAFEERLAPAEKASAEAWWTLATTGTEEAQRELVRAGVAYNRLFADEAKYELVKGLYEGRGNLESSVVRRQVEILYKTFAGRRGDPAKLEIVEELEARANAIYGNHRGLIGGEEVTANEVRDILRASDDPALRREAWESSKSVGPEVAGVVRELARLRNDLARAEGYENHYARSLDLQEIDAAGLARIMDGLEEATDGPLRAYKSRLDESLRERFGVEDVMPWHYSDPFFQEAPEVVGLDVDRYFAGKSPETLARETYDWLGLEVRDVLARSDLYERAGKDQHAFCLRVGREYPYDVRVLANVRPGDAYWVNTMLHELGHAVYDKYINPGLPYLLRTVAHTNSTEAIALMMGALADDPAWIQTVAGVSEEELAPDLEKLAERRRAERLVFTRWALVMYRFEQALYENPDRNDLNSLWWDLVERIQRVECPPGREGEHDWAAKIHVALAPVYYHNYVLGYLTAAQLKDHLERHVSGVPFHEHEGSGRYLQEAFFGPGARDNWRATVLRATGEELDPRHFVQTLS